MSGLSLLTDDRGGWVQTHTGKKFHPLDPRPGDIDVFDIAHSLSMQCRYNGHVREFYSVAQHSVLVSQLVDKEFAFTGLMHDATEAYVGDMVRPLKLHMADYQAVEDNVWLAVAEKFGLPGELPEEVKEADHRILLDERKSLMGEPPAEWDVSGEPFGITILGWSPTAASQKFLDRYWELDAR